jgi:predicted nucleotidyltransferase
MNGSVAVDQDRVASFCQRHRVRKLSLFGSVLRNDFRPESDIDVLVEFEPDAGVGFFELFDMERELSNLLGGRKVEINTPKSLSKYFRDKVLSEAEVQYVRA